jgi:Cu/Ag efflux protein CusF
VSRTSICAVLASGLLLPGPIVGNPRALDLAELCTSERTAGGPDTVNMARIFVGTGLVVAADPGQRVLTVNHRDMKGVMPPMTMMFRVKSSDLVEHLRPNDEIRFRITGSNMTIVAVAPLRRAE